MTHPKFGSKITCIRCGERTRFDVERGWLCSYCFKDVYVKEI